MSILKDEKLNLEAIRKLPIVGDQPESAKEEEFLREVCEYEFQNIEEAGLMLTFPYGDGNKSHTFTFLHGAKYKLPRFLARHVESCSSPIWKWRPNGLGALEKQYEGRQPRFQMREVFSRR